MWTHKPATPADPAQVLRAFARANSVSLDRLRDAALVLAVNDAVLPGFRSLTSALCLAQTPAMGLAFHERRAHGGHAVAALEDIDC